MPRFHVIIACLVMILCLSCGTGGSDDDSSDADPSDDDDTTGDDDGAPDDDADDDSIEDDDSADDDTFEPGTEFVEMVPVSDQVRLRTKVFLPDAVAEGGVPTMMTRTPYRFPDSDEEYEKRARVFVDAGYAFVLQDCRGRGESEGVFAPYTDENADALDTSAWIADQGWSDGTIGTMGASYDAFTALAAAIDNPRVKVVLAEEAPNAEAGPRKDGGTIGKGRLEWLHTLAVNGWMSDAQIVAVSNLLDVSSADTVVLGATDPYWQQLVAHPNPTDTLWSLNSLLPELSGICAPVLSIYSMELHWFDPIETWNGLREDGCAQYADDQRLMIVPEGHGYHTYTLPYFDTEPNELMRQYVDKFLGGLDVDFTTLPPVQYKAVADLVYWVADDWPPDTTDTPLYLDHDGSGGLLSESSAADPTAETLTVDPAVNDPCADTYPALTFHTTAYAGGAYIAGGIGVDLYISADTPDADVFVEVFEIPSAGDRRYVASGQTRLRYRGGGDAPLSPAEVVHVALTLHPVAFKVRNGSSLSLEVRPSHCGFFENPHTGEALAAQSHWVESTLTLYHNVGRASHLTIPFRN